MQNSYARVALDITSRALDGCFDYLIPESMSNSCLVGSTVLVSFSNRRCVGYVMQLSDEPSSGVPPAKILPILQVLADSAFDEVAAELAMWMAHEYAAPLADCVHLFLPPGQSIHVRRTGEDAPWELVCAEVGHIDDRWVSLTDAGRNFQPRSTATRQRALIAALSAGPVRMAELQALAGGMSQVVATLEKQGVVQVQLVRKRRELSATTLSSAHAMRPKQLTSGQKEALATIQSAKPGSTILIDGVTGSGKTEVYLAAIEEVVKLGKGAIVLVPEISLTPQTVGRFRSRFGDSVAVLHSRLSVGERFDQWDSIRRGEAKVVVGARSALFAPLPALGLIVIDEEHETSYKQSSSPRYHAREVAAQLAAMHGCPLVLGSATPSLESLGRCSFGSWRDASWRRVAMQQRPGSSILPEVHIADMTKEFDEGNRSIFSRELQDELLRIVKEREKAILFLNRRGFASFLMCRSCGCVPTCPHCSTSLTFHERTHELRCHTCNRSWSISAWNGRATRCPKCKSPYLAAFGIGTQRVEDELHLLLDDEVEIIRMDADTTKGKGQHQRLLEQFDAACPAVLVGTQMVAKGLDFPEVTLVGVVNADTTLKLPDFRAAERTYSLLEQVAGRAGRGDRVGKVIIQSYWAQHPVMQAVAQHKRSLFLEQELIEREESGYPPFGRLANIIMWGADRVAVAKRIEQYAEALRAQTQDCNKLCILGPAECIIAKANKNWRYHVLLKADHDVDMSSLLQRAHAALPPLPAQSQPINMALDIDAYDLM